MALLADIGLSTQSSIVQVTSSSFPFFERLALAMSAPRCLSALVLTGYSTACYSPGRFTAGVETKLVSVLSGNDSTASITRLASKTVAGTAKLDSINANNQSGGPSKL